MKIEIVSVKTEFFDICSFDKELLHNKNQARPHLIVIRLKYKNSKKINFALPVRSNIADSVNEWEYFKLPPNNKTLAGNHHGIHFTKMFPIGKKYKSKLNNSNNHFFTTVIEPFIKKHFKSIVISAQNYLEIYESGNDIKFSVNIDKVYQTLKDRSEI